MSLGLAFDVGLAVLVAGGGGLDASSRATAFGGGGRLRRLRPAAGARLGAPRRAGRGADRGRDRQRPDRLLLLARRRRLRRRAKRLATRAPGGGAARWSPGCSARGGRAALAVVVLTLPEPAPTLAPAGRREPGAARARQSGHRRADGLSRHRHPAGEGRAAAGAARRLVAGARSGLGRRARARAAAADPDGALVLLAQLLPPIGHRRRHLHRSGSAPIAPGGAFQGGAILAAMWLLVMMAGLREPPRDRPRAAAARCWSPGPPCSSRSGFAGFVVGGRLPRLSRRATPSR